MKPIPIRSSTLRGNQKIGFNIYVKISGRHVLYLRQGDSFEGERLTRLRQKKLKTFFIEFEDEKKYRDYISRNILAAYSLDSKLNIQTRSEIAHGLQVAAGEDLQADPNDKQIYLNALEGSRKYAEFIKQDSAILPTLIKLENVDQTIIEHGVSVATWSLAIAEHLGLALGDDLHLMSLAALIHDLGHGENEFKLSRTLNEENEKHPDDQANHEHQANPANPANQEHHEHHEHQENAKKSTENENYRHHPIRALDFVQNQSHIDAVVLKIITEHEECIDGSGYPHGLGKGQLHPLSEIVASANALDRLLSVHKYPLKKALTRLEREDVSKHPPEHIEALRRIISKT